ncbi:phosphoribosylformylglycinamidine cyclo-ligase [Enterococcus hirae]|uniref:phosphoribosylformylglycinamidine cyclo-ligase n=1 Tax=Enterococcus hirae TaxID=1354 RepID=UPI000DEB9AEE|nr:phosphoribosylformylglycinamidine cyclo-ligase [Enterococcus hirae]RBT48586.1 phosphoribosylformylglycinamidine cyclo-ligase [Enterococcus hirae]RBT54484.1 phosphoribosylformylglycinamidine cyclo-ligase [Enterococcus hirae]RBT55314.1 phosphoribosylformylglycinamidine cyclo-ligase [Enterococcus hirae]RBT61744.1 phosphoribosylformylglycinamidine cyclo-ligase [Enterococcus hirae]ROZ16135.1 phosphoribosylformylglycinamidine cyclo-ligase [Enterococcus hirae]
MSNAYANAGVDVEAGYEVVERIKKHVKKTERLGVMGALGGFGGCFDLSSYQLKEPVLVSGTDGVGTKLLVAIEADQHETIGIDCVAMCVNDILAQGAEPLYFLDYLATGKNDPQKLEKVVAGVAEGCVAGNLALIGGETAEMPGMYAENEYDLAGFAVGVAEKSQLITGSEIEVGDVLLGLPSSGIHSNGYSLVRKVFFEQNSYTLTDQIEGLSETLDRELLKPTKIYVSALLPIIKEQKIKGAAHITGGGFVENIPRMLPEGTAAQIQLGSWPSLPIFDCLQRLGEIPEQEMFEIFNMGIGMVVAVAASQVDEVIEKINEQGEAVYRIGEVVPLKNKAVLFDEEEK